MQESTLSYWALCVEMCVWTFFKLFRSAVADLYIPIADQLKDWKKVKASFQRGDKTVLEIVEALHIMPSIFSEQVFTPWNTDFAIAEASHCLYSAVF